MNARPNRVVIHALRLMFSNLLYSAALVIE
jgi:hypothetical protein